MKKIGYLIFLFLTPQSFLLAHTVADTTEFVPDVRWDVDIGSEIFGYSGALRSEYGMPAVFTLGGRVGFGKGKLTLGTRISPTTMFHASFPGEFFYDGSLRPVDVRVSQYHTLWAFDLRRDLWSHRHLHPFIDAGVTFSSVRTTLSIPDPNRRRNRESPPIEERDIHLNRQTLLSTGVGMRLKLTDLFSRDRDRWGHRPELFHYLYLEFRAGYVFGNPTSFVMNDGDPSDPSATGTRLHSTYQRPIASSPSDGFVLRITLGLRISEALR